MRPFIPAILCVYLFLLPAARAQSAFTGTWKGDPKTISTPTKPDIFMLRAGIFTCGNCGEVHPDVPADGSDHSVAGSPYFDALSVTVVDPRTVNETIKHAGRTVGFSTLTVSADGTTLTESLTDATATNAAPITNSITEKRVGAVPPNAHAISGQWRTAVFDASSNAFVLTFKLSGDTLSMSTPNGQSYVARLGGAEAPYIGDPGITSVSIRLLSFTALEETDKRGGKVVSVTLMTLTSNGNALAMQMDDRLNGNHYTWTATR